MALSKKQRAELRYGNNVQSLLIELASFDADDIDGDEFEVYGEDSNGLEGCATISITELAADAAKLLAEQEAELQEYRKADAREKIRAAHAEWSDATFGKVGPVGSLKHLAKEAQEAVAAPDDFSEWADMQFLLWDAQRRAGITDEQITQAMIDKLEVNKARQWPEPKDGEPRQHIKPAPQQEEKQCT